MSDRWCWKSRVDSRLFRSPVVADSAGNRLSGWRVVGSKGHLGVGFRRREVEFGLLLMWDQLSLRLDSLLMFVWIFYDSCGRLGGYISFSE